MFEFEQIATAAVVLLAIFGSINIIGGAIKTFKEWLKPATDMNARLKTVETNQKNDYKQLNDLEDAEKLLLKALNVLLEHEISGNHIEKLQEVQNEINEYLINR